MNNIENIRRADWYPTNKAVSSKSSSNGFREFSRRMTRLSDSNKDLNLLIPTLEANCCTVNLDDILQIKVHSGANKPSWERIVKSIFLKTVEVLWFLMLARLLSNLLMSIIR